MSTQSGKQTELWGEAEREAQAGKVVMLAKLGGNLAVLRWGEYERLLGEVESSKRELEAAKKVMENTLKVQSEVFEWRQVWRDRAVAAESSLKTRTEERDSYLKAVELAEARVDFLEIETKRHVDGHVICMKQRDEARAALSGIFAAHKNPRISAAVGRAFGDQAGTVAIWMGDCKTLAIELERHRAAFRKCEAAMLRDPNLPNRTILETVQTILCDEPACQNKNHDVKSCAHSAPSEPKLYAPCPQCGHCSPNIALAASDKP